MSINTRKRLFKANVPYGGQIARCGKSVSEHQLTEVAESATCKGCLKALGKGVGR